VALDDVLAVLMLAPRSYTGEDVAEIHCHGGSCLMRAALDLCLAAGARLARPGEFTQRAFLNGRLDLAQAEAVAALIGARSEQAARAALAQLDGRLSSLLHRFTADLRDQLTLVEAHIDFPDDDLGRLDLAGLAGRVAAVQEQMSRLLTTFDTGRALRDGVSVLILGRPNVGKSSLLNALLGEARAIVTEIPGTTRDTVEEKLVLGGVPLRLVDTAGVRDTADPIELEGVRRARDKVAAADLVLLVVDSSQPLCDEDRMAIVLAPPARTLLVHNKCDLLVEGQAAELAGFPRAVTVSARHGHGMAELEAAVVEFFTGGASAALEEGVVLTERRHREALTDALAALDRLRPAVSAGRPLECLAMELREALHALGGITGETTPDDILAQIFQQFCIGK